MVDDPRPLSKRLGAFLRRHGTAKQLALRLDCDHRTAENLCAGRNWPLERHWISIWAEFGEDVLEAVFRPELAEARLNREALEHEQARLRRLSALQMEHPSFGAAPGLDQAAGPADEALERDPLTLDLFEGFPTSSEGGHR